MTGYTRTDTANNIADGKIINASDLDGEYDAIQAAFHATTGHTHDGTTGGGAQIDYGDLANLPDVATLSGIETLTNKTLTDYSETVYSLSGTDIDPANGSIHVKILSAPTTITAANLNSGQSVTIMLENADTYAVTWPTSVWVTPAGNTAPTYTAKDVFVMWKVNSTIYISYAGSYA